MLIRFDQNMVFEEDFLEKINAFKKPELNRPI
jgi:hypothetical protein